MGRLENFERYMDKLVDGKEDTVNVLYTLRIGASRTEKEALDVAIDAVEKEPCDDVVSIQDVLKTMCEFCPVYNCTSKCSSYKHIKDLPSVRPQKQTGHWIIHGEPPINVIECSECGQKYHNHYHQPLAHFCSMCGCRMVEHRKVRKKNDL